MVERIPSPGVSAPLPARPVAPAERTADPRTEAFQRALSTMLGSKVPVSVLSRLGDGSFMVRVADMQVRMALPAGTQPGAELSMKVLAASPQPTFQLGDATLHGTPVPLSSNAASLAAAVAAASSPLTHSAGQHEGADLSPAARLLAQVLQNAQGTPASASVTGTAPLVPQGAPDPAQLASQLQQAIAKSGLFYESHVAEWAEGKRPLSELMGEPQAQKPPGTPPTDPALARMINMQLAGQEQGQLTWQGQLSPGQPLEWKVTREEQKESRGGDEPEPGWQSGLRLRFARLGEVKASITLRGRHVQIDLQAAPDVLAPLRDGAPRLQDALAAAGSELAALRIHGTDTP
ncbi:flagellar hook-length control protein FliK [Massilia sp. IC2-278]|uniref:flagellar hook-length control protein FliK n=1 Tax=Massilia sp. IC2-278 TaxID=2887200 RepID=UPI001E5A90EF|nr:flagellar hook-length control protein FliK [Massilia sp. IC2-278]MCC2962014.1 flagellar hook-length control protein FliK [Massilia sp. IC2-278]